MKDYKMLFFFILLRLLSIIAVQTSFVPDEYWQSLEVAHNLVFGYGYLTWEWTLGLRSYIYPLFIALIYKILYIVGLDTPELLIYTPRILQALLSAYSDFCFYRWCGTSRKKWPTFCIATSWFWFYTCSRTLLNTLECSLTTIGLYKFPWLGRQKEASSSFLWIVAILCAVRPTAALVWIPLCLYHVFVVSNKPLRTVFAQYLPIGASVFIVSTLIDSIAHGSFICTPYEFLKYNVVEDVGTWYGSEPWYWYLCIGFPVVFGLHCAPFIAGITLVVLHPRTFPNELALVSSALFSLAVYSWLSHKEFRFLLAILPHVLHLSARYVALASKVAGECAVRCWIAAFFLSNLVPALYVGLIHQRGALDVMQPIREIANSHPNASVTFLMPCHSTPLYSHIHKNVTVKFLTCNPPLVQDMDSDDDADRFLMDPFFWSRYMFPTNESLPTHIVVFDTLVERFRGRVLDKYKQTHKLFHTSFPPENAGKYITIHERLW